jgi:hypothetical protein
LGGQEPGESHGRKIVLLSLAQDSLQEISSRAYVRMLGRTSGELDKDPLLRPDLYQVFSGQVAINAECSFMVQSGSSGKITYGWQTTAAGEQPQVNISR